MLRGRLHRRHDQRLPALRLLSGPVGQPEPTTFSRPIFRFTLDEGLIVALAAEVMKISDTGLALAGELARHEWSCPNTDAQVLAMMGSATRISNALQAVIAETPRPHDYTRSLRLVH